MKILVCHGPNLNMLGIREPDLYGHDSLEDVNQKVGLYAKNLGVQVSFFQSNHEGELVETIQKAQKKVEGIVLNPASFTHTSMALKDAILSIQIPVVEVHLTNVHTREKERQISYTASACVGQIMGFGVQSYFLGIQALYLQSLSRD